MELFNTNWLLLQYCADVGYGQQVYSTQDINCFFFPQHTETKGSFPIFCVLYIIRSAHFNPSWLPPAPNAASVFAVILLSVNHITYGLHLPRDLRACCWAHFQLVSLSLQYNQFCFAPALKTDTILRAHLHYHFLLFCSPRDKTVSLVIALLI